MIQPIDPSYEGDIAVMYKGFLLVGHQLGIEDIGLVKAYRNMIYFNDNIVSYESTHFHLVYKIIDEAGDEGEFSKEQFQELVAAGKIEGRMFESLEQAFGKLPFMPELGEPLPEYVYKEVTPEFITTLMDPSVSEYGRVLVDKVALDFSLFMKEGNFTIVERLEETGWSSDDIAYSGAIRHTPTGSMLNMEVWISFEWRNPGKVESSTVTFIPSGEQISEERWKITPEDWEDDTFDLSAAGGRKADEMIKRYLG